MSYVQGRQGARAYGSMAVHTAIEAATPHKLVQMLMEGALEKMAAARGHMLQGRIAPKGENISGAIAIVEALRASLDMEAGGEIARNLHELYDYMTRRLLEANSRNDAAILDEVMGLVRQIKSAWEAVGAAVDGTPAAQRVESASAPLVSVGV